MYEKALYVLALSIFLLVGTNVSAMTKQDLKAKLTDTYTVGGKQVSAPANIVTEIERYLNKYDLSSKDCDYIAKKFDEALKVVQEAGATDFTSLSDSDKSKLVSIASDISKNTSVKVTLTKGGKLTIYESDGKTPFTVITDKDNGIKNTNNNYLVIVIASVISLLGVVVITKKWQEQMLKRICKLGKEIAKELTISFFISSLLIVLCFFFFGKKIDTYISLVDMITIGKTQSKAQNLKFDSVKKRLAVYPNWGTVWATIEIPKIGISIPVYHGDTLDIIKYGAGHYSGSYFPGEGGSIIIPAHNSRSHFMNIYQLTAGDTITIKASYGTFSYKVREGKVISDKDMDSLPIQNKKEELMLYTCWPVTTIGFKSKRYVIYAELEGATYE